MLTQRGHKLLYRPLDPEGVLLKQCDVVILRSATRITAQQLNAARGGPLKLIIRAGVGLDNIDLDAAARARIPVRNTPAAPVNAVSELAMALMLSCVRGISYQSRRMTQGAWEKSNGTELYGKRLGILGYGRIGRRIGKLAQGFGMEVSACDPAYPLEPPLFLTKDALLRQSDVLVLSTPALDHPVLDRKDFDRMKDGITLINVSRGQNLDEDALLEALNRGKVMAAGLDVWGNEPHINQALRDHPKVSCTPHIGASTLEAQARIGQEIVSILDHYCENQGNMV